jgi:raffinose/stachyose/melibiose transport system permease protein
MISQYTGNTVAYRVGVFFKYAVLIFMTLFSLFPIVWVIVSGFKTNSDLYAHAFSLPTKWVFENYQKVLKSKQLLSGYYNSFVTGFWVLILGLAFGSMVAYVSSRLLKNTALHTYFAIGIMIPMTSILIPTFHVMKNLGLVYTRYGIILAYVASTLPVTVFVLHGFMKGIPREMEEAAIIDGCSRASIFWSIILPMSKPGLATVLTMNVLNVWNDYLFSLIIGGQKYYNITAVIQNFRMDSENTTNYAMICAGIAFTIVPLALVYLLLQEHVIRGMAEGAIKA